MSDDKQQGLGTLAIHGGQELDPTTGAVMQPIYATSTYAQSSPGVHQGFEYSRTHNPTRFAWERCVAALEGGSRGFAFGSGLAATSTLLELLDSGDHVVAMDDIYGGSYRLFERVRTRSAGLSFSFVDLTDAAAFEAAITPKTRLVWIETPTNPLLKIVDIAAIAAIAKKHGLLVAVDNTFASPMLQRQMRGFGGIVSVRIAGGYDGARRFCERRRLFTRAESLGGVESLVNHPAVMTHASIPPARRAQLGIGDDLVRLSVGVEDLDDLRADLAQALA